MSCLWRRWLSKNFKKASRLGVVTLELYVFQGNHKNRSEELLRKAIETYAKEKSEPGLDFCYVDFTGVELKKTERGKPYIEGNPVSFSISHTGDIWSCLISQENVGLDIQQKRKANFNKLANRFFLQEEIKFVRDNGSDGFFDIWVCKEACVKYFGTGIRDLRSFCVVKDGKLLEEISFEGEDSNLAKKAVGKDSVCFINVFELAWDVKGAYCCGTKDCSLWIRELK